MILIADDAKQSRVLLREALSGTYSLLEAETGEQALWLTRQYLQSMSIILLRLSLCDHSGTEVLREMRKNGFLEKANVLALVETPEEAQRALEMGAFDILMLPVQPEVAANRVKRLIELCDYQGQMQSLVEVRVAADRGFATLLIETLISAIESRTLEPSLHIRRVSTLTGMLLEDFSKTFEGDSLSDETIREMASAASLHDIGKITIPDSILMKQGRLTPEEFEVMKTHTTNGCNILKWLSDFDRSDFLRYAYEICRYHHERWDGGGYPDGLRGDQIPLCAQAAGLADCYDMLTVDRVYSKAIPPNEALNMILNGACGAFAPALIESLKNVCERFMQLTAEWADTQSSEAGARQLLAVPPVDDEDSASDQSVLKYFALLRYLNETILEVDLQSDTYHLMYLANQDFAALRSTNSFVSSIQNFADCVHPDDREMVRNTNAYLMKIFDNGLLRRDRSYRVLNRESGMYEDVRETALRINPESSARQNVLVICQRAAQTQTAAPPLRTDFDGLGDTEFDNLINGALICEVDRCFHIRAVNHRFEDLTGYTKGEIERRFGNRYIELVYPADRAGLIRQFWALSAHSRQFELEYRIVCKNGEIRWVSEQSRISGESGCEFNYCVLIDVTSRHKIEEELRLSLERYRIIIDQTNDVIFEWNIAADSLMISNNWKKRYGYQPIQENASRLIPEISRLHPEDKPEFYRLVEAIKHGTVYNEVEFRVADAQGKYRWALVRATTQFDADGMPYKAVGVVMDIDEQKRVAHALEERAARDVLTKLYNKEAAQLRVEQALSASGEQSCSALLVIDVDDFKHINDRYGHMMGDAVLSKIAECLTRHFRAADTAARIGGDEFMVFMPDIPDEAMACRRAESVLKKLRNILQDSMQAGVLSCSIGIATAYGGEPAYAELFKRADFALYKAKSLGKNQFACYVPDDNIHNEHALLPRTGIDSDNADEWDLPSFMLSCFDLLYRAEDIKAGVYSILKSVGETFGVSRVYAYTCADDSDCLQNWCRQGVRTITREMLGALRDGQRYSELFDEEGIFCCSDIDQLELWKRTLLSGHDARSMLKYALYENKKLVGIVGFDDCQIHRLWTKSQMQALILIGKLLLVFLQKGRAQQLLAESAEKLYHLLDRQKVLVYAVNPEDYTLRYMNRKTVEAEPEARVGRTCYEALMHRDTPCTVCPMRVARERRQSTMELYNPHVQGWILADAVMVSWEDERLCFLTCRNITEYKKGPSPFGD